MKEVRTRFAPSPTGPLHIGGLRTALYNYLFAKSNGGNFILRIEDTDKRRFVQGAEDYIVNALKWVGLEVNEGPLTGGRFAPYRQSERSEIYTRQALKLVESGNAYYAFDTVEELESFRNKHEGDKGQIPKYNHQTRRELRNSFSLTSDEVAKLIEEGAAYTIRLNVPAGQEVIVNDLIRGEVKFKTDELDDKILLKADGMPTYHLANVVDDYDMEISHVIRGEEWLSSTAHHILIYRGFGWDKHIPAFAHLPLILKPSGKGKLSKRDGQKFGFPVFPLKWESEDETYNGFREYGFEPAALLNFLALQGWNPGIEQEIFTIDELINLFRLDKVVKSGARFDWQKALWFNQQHLINLSLKEIAQRLNIDLQKKGIKKDYAFLHEYAILFKDRVSLFSDYYKQAYFLFEPVNTFDEKTIRKKWKQENINHYKILIDEIEKENVFTKESTKELISNYLNTNHLKFGNLLPLLRMAISGAAGGPDLFSLLALLGKETSLSRLKGAIKTFDGYV